MILHDGFAHISLQVGEPELIGRTRTVSVLGSLVHPNVILFEQITISDDRFGDLPVRHFWPDWPRSNTTHSLAVIGINTRIMTLHSIVINHRVLLVLPARLGTKEHVWSGRYFLSQRLDWVLLRVHSHVTLVGRNWRFHLLCHQILLGAHLWRAGIWVGRLRW